MIDNKLAEAHVSLAVVKFQYDRDWPGAEEEFRTAIALNPNYAPAHEFFGNFLKALGRFDEALAETERALELDPLSPTINTGAGHVLYLSRQYDRAIEQYRKTLALDPSFAQAHLWFTRPYLQKGMFKEAISEVQQALDLSGETTIILATLGHAYASAGERDNAIAVLRKLEERSRREYVPSYWIALIHVGLDDKDQAFKWLEAAYEERSSWLSWVKVEPRFDGLRHDSRFSSLIQKMGLLERAEAQESSALDERTDSFPMREKVQVETEVRSVLSKLDSITLSRFRVVGDYTRYDANVRNLLKDLKQKIVEGLETPLPKNENYLIWSPPGGGKTFFVNQVTAGLEHQSQYCELNLAETDESRFRSTLTEMDASGEPFLCFVDEMDSKPNEPWPYEALLKYLEVGPKRRTSRVFILAGSSGSSLEDMKGNIASRPKGTDLLTRIPHDNEFSIPAMRPEDRILTTLANLKKTGKMLGREVSEVEKLALYYVALNPKLANPRQLRELSLRCVERMPPAEDRVKYDHIFAPGNQENKEFWLKSRSATPELINSFVLVND